MVKSQFIFDFREKLIRFVRNAFLAKVAVDRITEAGGEPSTWLPPEVTCQAGIHHNLPKIIISYAFY